VGLDSWFCDPIGARDALQFARETGAVNLPRKSLNAFNTGALCRSPVIVAGLCVVFMVLALFGASGTAAAQSPAKIYRIGWLSDRGPPSGSDRSAAEFQQGLRDVGLVETKNITVEYRYATGNVERLPELAAQLVHLQVDVIVTSGEAAALAAKHTTSSIPIVMTEIGVDPVRVGLVASLARPGGNVTGVASLSNDLWQKRLALLKEFTPKVFRVSVLWNPANPGNADCVAQIKESASALAMQVLYFEVSSADALEAAFIKIPAGPSEALVACLDSVTLERARSFSDFALKRRLPTLAPVKEYVQAGGLLSLGANLAAQRRRAASYVDRILKGAKPADLPVERPTLFELVVNRTTAKALGLAVPAAFTVLADEFID
jgi:putative tryptophan/tyrosine transport system substrate-binding protein